MKPQERILSERFRIPSNITSLVDPWIGLRNQVHPVKAKVENNHWILLSFSFSESIVRIYDSLGYKRATNEQRNMEKMLPYAIYAADPSQIQLDLERKWKREYVSCVTQPDFCTCWAFLLAFVECVLRGIPPEFEADPLQMRYRIARDLIDCGELPPKRKT
ncbi:hypothetical protein AQUCO_08400006v1 [Aquilegia coerulea]|uniref:Ubiquitin-like protease family profile domain-containing protein n=1 Tax=Aquilegia coerulea TaxID=218851 RepID=A0A2G5C6Q1_AQUCA|nr:hypothetical protein AQUCO_08400006v1 [Aquilegia coerulea]